MIAGKKVRLRAFRDDDLKNIVAWINNPAVTRYLTHMRPWSVIEERAWLDRTMRNDDPSSVTWVVETSDGEYAGSVGLMHIDLRNRKAEVGIVIAPEAYAALDALARCALPVVPVFIADRGIEPELTSHALTLNFAGVMADTADKRAGSLFDAVSRVTLARFVAQARIARVMVGLAGALRLVHVHALAELAPDFAGFRSAVCAGERSGALDASRVRELASALRLAQASLGRPKTPDAQGPRKGSFGAKGAASKARQRAC